MPDYTVSGDVDSMLRSADDAAIRSAIGVGTTDAPTFLGVNINASGAVPGSGMAWNSSDHLAFYHNSTIRMVVLSTGTTIGSDMAYSWGSANIPTSASRDLILARDAAGILAQRNGTNAQTLRIYNTTDGTNKEYLNMGWSANVLNIGASNEGTGVQRDIKLAANSVIIRPAGTDRWIFTNIGHLWAGADNAYDIGASGANRPRSIYVGQDVIAGAGYSFRFATAGGFGGSLSNLGNGIFALLNSAQNGFGRLQLGGITSAFPAIKRNGTGIDIRLADDSAFAPVKGKITTDTEYTATVVTPTGFLTLYDSTGTAYRVPCVV